MTSEDPTEEHLGDLSRHQDHDRSLHQHFVEEHRHQNQQHHLHSSGGGNDSDGPPEQDRYLPIANISRIMKKALVSNAKIAKDAKETVQECVSEFISFITSEASDKCQQEKRKTINGEDILWAMQSLGFDNYCEPLSLYLFKYRELVEKGTPKQRGSSKKESPEAAPTSSTPHQLREIFQSNSYLPTAQVDSHHMSFTSKHPSYLPLQSQSFSDSDSSSEVTLTNLGH